MNYSDLMARRPFMGPTPLGGGMNPYATILDQMLRGMGQFKQWKGQQGDLSRPGHRNYPTGRSQRSQGFMPGMTDLRRMF